MTTVVAGPFQPDDVETRERMRVATSIYPGPLQLSKLEHEGVIDYETEYKPSLVIGSIERFWSTMTEYREDEQAYAYVSRAWLTTLGASFPGVEASYEADLVAIGGATHMQDPWVGDLLTDMTTAINAQVAAGTHPGVPAGLLSWSVEFETDDDLYPGSVSGRFLEISSDEIDSAHYDRAEVQTAGGGIFDGLTPILIPRSISDPPDDDPDFGDYAVPTPFYATTGSLGTPPDAWFSPPMETRALAQSPEATLTAGGVYLPESPDDGTPVTIHIGGGTAIVPVIDSVWEASKWPITRFGADVNYGVPVMLTPTWLAKRFLDPTWTPAQPYGLEAHTSGTASATVYMNAVWTPPRYRIIYDREFSPSPYRLIQRPSDDVAGSGRQTYRATGTTHGSNRTIGASW